jgi:hypothetical protein
LLLAVVAVAVTPQVTDSTVQPAHLVMPTARAVQVVALVVALVQATARKAGVAGTPMEQVAEPLLIAPHLEAVTKMVALEALALVGLVQAAITAPAVPVAILVAVLVVMAAMDAAAAVADCLTQAPMQTTTLAPITPMVMSPSKSFKIINIGGCALGITSRMPLNPECFNFFSLKALSFFIENLAFCDRL